MAVLTSNCSLLRRMTASRARQPHATPEMATNKLSALPPLAIFVSAACPSDSRLICHLCESPDGMAQPQPASWKRRHWLRRELRRLGPLHGPPQSTCASGLKESSAIVARPSAEKLCRECPAESYEKISLLPPERVPAPPMRPSPHHPV